MDNKKGSAGDHGPPGTERVNVIELLGPNREVLLVYKDAEYRLRLTRNDKLILTK